jgi:hypothetical protein
MPKLADFTFEKRKHIRGVYLRVRVFLQNPVEFGHFLFEIGIVGQNEEELVVFVRLLELVF